MFQFCLETLNDLCYTVSENLSVKPLSSTWIISVFITICSLQIVVQIVANLAMITALKCTGLSHVFRCVVEKNNVIRQYRSVRIGKNCAQYSKTSGTAFPNTDLPAGE